MRQTIKCRVFLDENPPTFMSGRLDRMEPGKYKLKINSVGVPKSVQHSNCMDIEIEFKLKKIMNSLKISMSKPCYIGLANRS